jgi:ribosome-associated toxin RatA of RatAB toxin-antitoxin module
MPKKASVVLVCEPSLIYEILTDYDSYSEWMPLVTSSRLLAQEGDLAIAELAVDVGRLQTLSIECIHDRDRMVLSRAIGSTLLVSKVEWTISPAGPGQSKVDIAMHARRWWSSFHPSHRRFLNPEACLEGLRKQVALFDAGAGVAVPGAERILQIHETQEGLIAWYLGKQYKMTPVAEQNP